MTLRIVILLCLLFVIQSDRVLAQQDSDVLFTVEGNAITVEEFRYIYEKNNGDGANYSEKSVMEYLELYKNFKLKVNRAKEMKLDTIPALIKELGGYRKQLANSYLNDKEVTANLVEEVIQRMETDREVSHIFIPLDRKATSEAKREAQSTVDGIYARLNRGEDFKTVAIDASEDKASAVNGGYLGYYTSPLPSGFYAFENAMYSTAIGSVAKPIQSKMGFHIIKVHSERPARGELEIAHILIRKKTDGVLNPKAKIQIDSMYNLINNGTMTFEQMAKSSQDPNTANKEGYLGFMRINQYESTFEDAAFALASDGDISMPIETEIGWHLIKRISKKDVSDKDKLRRSMKAKLAKDDRLELSKKTLINSIKEEAGMQVNNAALNSFQTKLHDDFYSYKWKVPAMTEMDLITFANGTKHKLSAFADYCKRNTKERLKHNTTTPIKEVVSVLFENYVDDVVLQYEESNLEAKYPAFKALMREYEEGILLFEATKMEVWDKASSDSLGLRTYYSNNTQDYTWEERAKVQTASVQTNNAKALKKVGKALSKMNLNQLKTKFESDDVNITVSEPELVTKGTEMGKSVTWEPGYTKQETTPDNILVITKVLSVEPVTPKTFSEAKGYIIADYQDQLEQEWIAKLSDKYPVTINQDILDKLIK